MKNKVVLKRHKKELENYEEIRIYEVSLEEKENYNRYVNDKKLLTNLATTKRNIINLLYLNMNENSTFLTLTYKANIQDYQQAAEDFKKFVKRVNYYLGIKLSYLGVKELQQRGAIHFHIIIFSEQFRDLTHEQVAQLWGHGFIYIKPIMSWHIGTHQAVANYFAKYLTNYFKDQLIARDKKLFFTSRNIKRPHIEKLSIATAPHYIRKANIIVGNKRMTKLLIKK